MCRVRSTNQCVLSFHLACGFMGFDAELVAKLTNIINKKTKTTPNYMFRDDMCISKTKALTVRPTYYLHPDYLSPQHLRIG